MAVDSTVSNLFAVIRPGSVIDESIIHVLYAEDTSSVSLFLKIMVLHTEMGAGPYVIKLHKHIVH